VRFWSTVCSIVEVAMRFGRIPDRRGQVWQKTWFDSRKRECTETLLVLDEPVPLRETTLDRLLSDTPVWLRRGWLHQTVNIETGEYCKLNEKWFGSWSEESRKKGDPGYKRVN
jgi:hypothetical protein